MIHTYIDKFENAKVGDKYITQEGYVAEYLGCDEIHFPCFCPYHFLVHTPEKDVEIECDRNGGILGYKVSYIIKEKLQ